MKLVRWIIVFGVLSSQTYVFAQDAKLVEAARKEGAKVIIYGSLETPVLEGVIQAFRKKTGITAEYWRASAMSVMNRAMTEYRAGKPGYDVVLNNSDPLVIMANDGMLAQYDSPTAKKYLKDQIDPRLARSLATASSVSFITRDWSSRMTPLSRSKISSIQNTKGCW